MMVSRGWFIHSIELTIDKKERSVCDSEKMKGVWFYFIMEGAWQVHTKDQVANPYSPTNQQQPKHNTSLMLMCKHSIVDVIIDTYIYLPNDVFQNPKKHQPHPHTFITLKVFLILISLKRLRIIKLKYFVFLK